MLAQMLACPACRTHCISIDENARALFKEIECPRCGQRLRVKWADPMRVLGVILVLALGLLMLRYRGQLSSGALTGVFVCLAAVGMALRPMLRRLPLARAS
jgi:uncharacterized protein YbaR (Trm112 family)